ncbi:hypothetical protein IF1G_03712 [Cordyceps javanica]|uniref:Uncharacterized protein n=1 Tax=Cordyceps javanica TaxID=43265 RepID=A0A545V8N5_9HYPO|nr:hypothetical protein IF1G_03712 [Cordyceps javanica]TQW08851.1 hypothetical protein IF2G_03282 [Cordyceps javanica]
MRPLSLLYNHNLPPPPSPPPPLPTSSTLPPPSTYRLFLSFLHLPQLDPCSTHCRFREKPVFFLGIASILASSLPSIYPLSLIANLVFSSSCPASRLLNTTSPPLLVPLHLFSFKWRSDTSP